MVHGRVSEGLTFELGTRAGAPPLSVWRGERRAERCREVDREAIV